MVIVPRILIPKDKLFHRLCIHCYSDRVEYRKLSERFVYECSQCGKVSARALVFDPNVIWWIDENSGTYWHESVGIFIFDAAGRMLLFQRTIYPYSMSIPSGHLDPKETPSQGAIRELMEETGIVADEKQLVRISEECIAGDACSRGSDHHYWHLYMISVNVAHVRMNEVGREPKWISMDSIDVHELLPTISFLLNKHRRVITRQLRRANKTNSNGLARKAA